MPKRRVARIVCRCLLCLLVGLAATGPRSARPTWGEGGPHHPTEPERIVALLDVVERSGARFVREGKEYSAANGRKHLERKLRYAGNRITTAEEFIEGIASRSSTTGRPYKVRLPTGEEIEISVWLQQRLAEIDARP